MNFLVIKPEELAGPGSAVLQGDRAQRVIDVHVLRPGMRVAALVMGGRGGHAVVRELSPTRAVLDLELERDPLPREALTVIVAVPRPQSVKKVLQIAGTTGLERVCFIRSERVEKSYLQSKSLRPEAVDDEILKGLEQSGDARAPEVEVHRSFSGFMRERLPELVKASDAALFLHTAGGANERAERISPKARVLVAIGPEAGWTAEEAALFEGAGFTPLSLGSRILRVDTALAVLVGRVQAMRRDSK